MSVCMHAVFHMRSSYYRLRPLGFWRLCFISDNNVVQQLISNCRCFCKMSTIFRGQHSAYSTNFPLVGLRWFFPRFSADRVLFLSSNLTCLNLAPLNGEVWLRLMAKYGSAWWRSMAPLDDEVWLRSMAKNGSAWWRSMTPLDQGSSGETLPCWRRGYITTYLHASWPALLPRHAALAPPVLARWRAARPKHHTPTLRWMDNLSKAP